VAAKTARVRCSVIGPERKHSLFMSVERIRRSGLMFSIRCIPAGSHRVLFYSMAKGMQLRKSHVTLILSWV
jgi:hypothetical protein